MIRKNKGPSFSGHNQGGGFRLKKTLSAGQGLFLSRRRKSIQSLVRSQGQLRVGFGVGLEGEGVRSLGSRRRRAYNNFTPRGKSTK